MSLHIDPKRKMFWIFQQTGLHNLRSFLAANLTQNYFLIARMLSFLWQSWQKWHIQHFATKWDHFWYRKWIEREEIKRKWGNVESESLSITSFSLHFFFIFSFSLHFLAARVPGCHYLCNPASLIQKCDVTHGSPIWPPWSKNVTSLTGVPSPTEPLDDPKNWRNSRGAPTDLLDDPKKWNYSREAPNDLLLDPKTLCYSQGPQLTSWMIQKLNVNQGDPNRPFRCLDLATFGNCFWLTMAELVVQLDEICMSPPRWQRNKAP